MNENHVYDMIIVGGGPGGSGNLRLPEQYDLCR